MLLLLKFLFRLVSGFSLLVLLFGFAFELVPVVTFFIVASLIVTTLRVFVREVALVVVVIVVL